PAARRRAAGGLDLHAAGQAVGSPAAVPGGQRAVPLYRHAGGGRVPLVVDRRRQAEPARLRRLGGPRRPRGGGGSQLRGHPAPDPPRTPASSTPPPAARISWPTSSATR